MGQQKKPFERLMDPEDDAILVWAVVPSEKYDEFKFPDRCYASAVKIGKVGELHHKMHAAHWGITIGKALMRLGENLIAHLPKAKVIDPFKD